MNQSLTLNRLKNHRRRISGVDIEHSQKTARLAQQLVLFSSYAVVRCVRCEIRECPLNATGSQLTLGQL